ncbi:MAG TPA: hypothetical protein VF681_02825 [Abditibacteriaceae bacterium]|jgi:oligosaccharide amylase
MPVYLPSAVLGDDQTLLTVGNAGELQAWFWPSKDHAQHIHQNLLAIHAHGALHFTYNDIFKRTQRYDGDSNVLVTELVSDALRVKLTVTDVIVAGRSMLLRRFELHNFGEHFNGSLFTLGDWNLGGVRMGNGVRFDHSYRALVQTHHDASVAIGGEAVQSWHCGKAGENWGNNARYAVQNGHLGHNDLEIGDVNWAFGCTFDLGAGETTSRVAVYALASTEVGALEAVKSAPDFDAALNEAKARDAALLAPGLATLKEIGAELPADLDAAYRRSLLCLPLLCGKEGVAVAAPEFDPEFIACGGYGYHWPRDGGEYISGLIDAGYPEYAEKFFDWCARHQDAAGLWHQRYFLNGQPAPNWCLPPDMLQIDQVGAVLWAYGKWKGTVDSDAAAKPNPKHRKMIKQAADYLISRLTERGVHGNAFDTWETFVGSFTYSNAAIYAAFVAAHEATGEKKYAAAAKRIKDGVLKNFVKGDEYPYLARGFDSQGNDDYTVDSASLGAIEPFGLLDLNDPRELEIAEGTLRAVTERLDVEWQGGRAIRRFEGDAYVGGVPACVNTLWMARCCLLVADRFDELGRKDVASELTRRAQEYLQTVLRRATPTGLLPELMQGPEGQTWWAAPHGWAMSSFVSGTLRLARRMAKK